jgi:hypothetical protein
MGDPALWFPGANTSHLAPSDGGSILGGKPKALWHDTETANLPSYSNGSFPNMTICGTTPYQHIPANRAGRALKNPDGGCQTNRWNVFQIEVCGYANQVTFKQVMADVAGWLHERRGVPLTEGVSWKSYDASYGAGNGVRLSCSQWESYSGHLGHMHAPENDHGDPGWPFPIDQILAGGGGEDLPDIGDIEALFIKYIGEHRLGDAQDEPDSVLGRLDRAVMRIGGKTNASYTDAVWPDMVMAADLQVPAAAFAADVDARLEAMGGRRIGRTEVREAVTAAVEAYNAARVATAAAESPAPEE